MCKLVVKYSMRLSRLSYQLTEEAVIETIIQYPACERDGFDPHLEPIFLS